MAGLVVPPSPGGEGSKALPPLRQDLALYPGEPEADGSPTWTLHDPAANRFYRIGWVAFEILSRWGLGSPAQVARAVRAQTTLQADADDVLGLTDMLLHSHLCEASTADDSRRLLSEHQAGRRHWAKWLLEHYLFFRVPLWRPMRLLRALTPWVGWVYTRGFLLVLAGLLPVGLFLVSRQWDGFVDSFKAFDHWSGFIGLGLALSFSKVLHEFGHALTAARHGCKVPSMGVAFLVMWPVLYTDVNEAWKLPARRQRLRIAGAGIATELALAVLATFAWSFLPEGPLKVAAFMLATSTWLITLAINASPFMRFDGYFLLCDWLGIDNLHARSFAFGRWWLRETLFALGAPSPEVATPGRRRFLVAFAFATWAYRLVLFLGIALLVYHFFFKLLGILLMLVELGWFIARPVALEAAVWWKLRKAIMKHPRSWATLAVFVLLAAAFALPLQTTVRAPAMLTLEARQAIYAPLAGVAQAPLPVVGQTLRQGETLFRLRSPDIDFQLAHARLREQPLRWQQERQALDESLRREGGVIGKRQQEAAGSIQAWSRERDRLAINSPLDGVVLEVNDQLNVGGWVSADEWLAFVGQPRGARVEAYVEEADLARLRPDAPARFVPETGEWPLFQCRLAAIDRSNVAVLEHPALAVPHGGPLAVKGNDRAGLVPAGSHFRARFDRCDPAAAPPRELRGTLHIEAEQASLAARWWRGARAVLLREAGF
ncbi:MAG: HlyD family efflux transporter periplasmic adaptor subunit [Gallionellaceae bacterium]|nr:HlyD family efflux transporter periplasmic adaptor subunit [Gallionellaceae bacterium]